MSARVGHVTSGRRVLPAVELARALGLPHPPTAEQVAVIEAPLAPALVIAGAGSGKTQTMALRVCWLVANGLVEPERILGLTFTRKAAGELAERVRGLLARLDPVPSSPEPAMLAAGPTVSTYHSYAGRVFAENALRLGREPRSRLLGAASCWQLMTQVVDSYDGPMDAVPWSPGTVTERALALAGDLAEHQATPTDLRALATVVRAKVSEMPRGAHRGRSSLPKPVSELLEGLAAREQLLGLVERFTAAKADADAIDFGDQVALAAQVAQAHPEVGITERDRFDVVLLDEYQDTGHAQRCLLQALFGGGHPVVAVGDPCQSIYGWRGASAGNLTRFPTDFADRLGPARTFTLSTSFRNAHTILEVANTVAGPLRATGVPVPELTAGTAAPPGRVVAALHETEDDEACWVADQVAALLGGPEDPVAAPSAYAPGDVAILVRKRAQMPPLAAALAERGVPVEVAGLGGLLATAEVADVVAVLRVLAGERGGVGLMRLLAGPRWRLGPRDLVALGRRARELSPDATGASSDADDLPADIVEALEDLGPPTRYSPAGWERLSALRAELRSLRRRSTQPLPDLVNEIIATTRLDVEVAVGASGGQRGRAHLEAFLDTASAFAEEETHASPSAFCRWLEAAEDEERGLARGEPDTRRDAVTIVTVHGAKGLEWPVVVVAGVAEGIFPGKPRSSTSWARSASVLPFPLRGDRDDLPELSLDRCADHAELQQALAELKTRCEERDLLEERRLAYVAVTRAKLVLLVSGHRWGTGVKARPQSVFLTELVEHVDSGVVEVAAWAPEPLPDAVSPAASSSRTHPWPFDALSAEQRVVLEQSAAAVRDAMACADGPGPVAALPPAAGARDGDAGGDARADAAGGAQADAVQVRARGHAAGEAQVDAVQVRAWHEEVERLLGERDEARRADVVELPGGVSVSDLVALHRDPAALALRLRRPMPAEPAPLARRGTALHAWLERRFRSPALFDIDEVPGAADDEHGSEGLDELRAAFVAGQFGDRVPVEVEVPFETTVAGVVVRGRIDAIFRDDDGRYDVIDWKTGRIPTGASARSAAIQLAAYRLAWAALAGVDPDDVRAGFHYVGPDVTVRPEDLPDAEGLAALLESVPASSG